jgi:hypothetical protein
VIYNAPGITGLILAGIVSLIIGGLFGLTAWGWMHKIMGMDA